MKELGSVGEHSAAVTAITSKRTCDGPAFTGRSIWISARIQRRTGCSLTYYCCQVSDILVAWLMLVVMPSDVGGAGAVDITKRMRRPVVGQNRSRSGS